MALTQHHPILPTMAFLAGGRVVRPQPAQRVATASGELTMAPAPSPPSSSRLPTVICPATLKALGST